MRSFRQSFLWIAVFWGVLAGPAARLRGDDDPMLAEIGLRIGEQVPDWVLFDRAGREYRLLAEREHYTVYVGACNTCQMFLNQVDALEQLADEFRKEPVRFYYLHKGVVHPELRNLVPPYTLREEHRLVDQFQTELGSKVPWLVQGPDGKIGKVLGPLRPNIQLVVDPRGKLVHLRNWSNAAELRRQLTVLFPRAASATVEAPPPQPARKLIAERLPVAAATDRMFEKPQFMPPLQVAPRELDPNGVYRLKLRAEVDRSVLKGQAGRLYLRLEIDPVYESCWVNPDDRPGVSLFSIGESPRRIAEMHARIERQVGECQQGSMQLLTEAPRGLSEMEVRVRYRIKTSEGERLPLEQRFLVRFEERPD